VITTVFEKEKDPTIVGKVATIGRDFVMLTNLHNRIWLPYTSIESATIPFGTPTFSNTHQHHIYDNQLRQKLVLQFGETVSKRDTLVQQFFEESIRTNLQSWKGTWVEVKSSSETVSGKIAETDKKNVYLQFGKKNFFIPLEEIQYVSTLRFVSLWKELLKSIF
jgi:hypothetical protein